MKSKHGRVHRKYAMNKGWQIALIDLCCCCAMLGAAIDPGIGSVWAQESFGEQKTLIYGKEESTFTDACYDIVTAESTASSEPESTSSYESTETSAPAVESAAPAAAESETTPAPAAAEPETTPASAVTPAADSKTISLFTMSEPITLVVTRETSVEDVCDALPQTLPAADENGKAIEVPVTWKADSDAMSEIYGEDAYTNGSRYDYGPWNFTAAMDSGYSYNGENITAQVSVPDCAEIASLCGQCSDGLLMKFPIGIGGSVNLNAITYTGAMMSDGGYKNVPIAFSGSYDNSKAGTYRYEIQVTGDYTGATSAWAEIVVEDYR